MTLRGLFLFLHVLGVALWLGVGLTLAFVTGRAARQGSGEVVAFAYRLNDRLMRTLGLTGMVLTLAGGIGLTAANPAYGWFQPFPDHWLFQMQLLGFLAVGIGAFYQLPLGRRLAEAAEESARRGEATDAFRTYRKRNAVVASVNGLVLLILILLGTLRPM